MRVIKEEGSEKRRWIKKSNRSSFFWLFFSVFICLESYRLNLGTLSTPGPGLFPFGAGLTLGLISLTLIFKSPLKNDTESMGNKLQKGYRILLVLLALIAYGLVLEWAGFLIATFCFMVFLLKIIVPQRWDKVLMFAILSSIGSYLVFEVWLKAQLPKGFLG